MRVGIAVLKCGAAILRELIILKADSEIVTIPKELYNNVKKHKFLLSVNK
jgi:hypothetical protein